MRRVLLVAALCAAAPALSAAQPTRSLELPSVADPAALAPGSWVFLAIDPDGTLRVGEIPARARTKRGVALARLPAGTVVDRARIHEAWLDGVKAAVARLPKRPAIADAGAAPGTCGDALPMLHGTMGAEAGPPLSVRGCRVDPRRDPTAPVAALVLADRELASSVVLDALAGDSGVLARLALTSDGGKHARAVPIELHRYVEQPANASVGRVIALDGASDPKALAADARRAGGAAWVWLAEDVPYARLLEVVAALSSAGVDEIVLSREAPPRRPGSDVPRVRVGTPTVSSGLDPAVVRRVIKKRQEAIEACGAALPARVGGTVTLELTIGAGRLTAATAHGVNADAEACLVRALEGSSFPRSDGNVAVVARVPIEIDAGP